MKGLAQGHQPLFTGFPLSVLQALALVHPLNSLSFLGHFIPQSTE